MYHVAICLFTLRIIYYGYVYLCCQTCRDVPFEHVMKLHVRGTGFLEYDPRSSCWWSHSIRWSLTQINELINEGTG